MPPRIRQRLQVDSSTPRVTFSYTEKSPSENHARAHASFHEYAVAGHETLQPISRTYHAAVVTATAAGTKPVDTHFSRRFAHPGGFVSFNGMSQISVNTRNTAKNEYRLSAVFEMFNVANRDDFLRLEGLAGVGHYEYLTVPPRQGTEDLIRKYGSPAVLFAEDMEISEYKSHAKSRAMAREVKPDDPVSVIPVNSTSRRTINLLPDLPSRATWRSFVRCMAKSAAGWQTRLIHQRTSSIR